MIVEGVAPSRHLGEGIRYLASLPVGTGPRPVVYLLHGRGHSAESWLPVLGEFSELFSLVLVAPDAPWSSRAGYYVDSRGPGGRPIESAFIDDLIPHVEERIPILSGRSSRVVAGFSMGGAGAVRLGLAHSELFGAVIALSPAVYVPEPPLGSSAREFGAFGGRGRMFDSARYRRLGYPTLLHDFPRGRQIRLFVSAGTDEDSGDVPAALTIPVQAARLAEQAASLGGIDASFTLYRGGHDISTWAPGLRDALSALAETR